MRLAAILIRFIFLIVLLPIAANASAFRVVATDVVVGSGYERFILVTNQRVKITHFVLNNPERLVLDMPTAVQTPKNPLPSIYQGELIKKVRFGRFDADTTRMVLDLNRRIEVRQLSHDKGLGGNYTLVLELRRVSKASGTRLPVKDGIDTNRVLDVLSQTPEVKAPPKKDKFVVVIDAGHGGVDPGAVGLHGQFEKYITLEYAKALRDALNATGRYKAKLTRDDDHFILLRERVKKARAESADIFLSLHADAAEEHYARGLSVYTLSEKASDKEAELLAAKENKVDVLSGIDLSDESKDVADILIDLAQRETKNKSSLLAESIIGKMKSRVKLLQNTHRFAGFAVLKAPDVPSVLVELGFLTNKEDQKLLKQKKHKAKVVKGLVEGIDAYFKNYKKE